MKTCYLERTDAAFGAVADLVYIKEQDAYLVTRINVPPKWRGQGFGRRLLKQVLDDADREGATLIIEPSPSFGNLALTFDALVNWYHRHGFVWAKLVGMPDDEAIVLIRYATSHWSNQCSQSQDSTEATHSN